MKKMMRIGSLRPHTHSKSETTFRDSNKRFPHKLYPSNGKRAAWVAGPDGQPTFTMVPHSTPTQRMSRDWSHSVIVAERNAPVMRNAWEHRRTRYDWRDRREDERRRARNPQVAR